jgi:hypothetical protein
MKGRLPAQPQLILFFLCHDTLLITQNKYADRIEHRKVRSRYGKLLSIFCTLLHFDKLDARNTLPHFPAAFPFPARLSASLYVPSS